MHWLVDRIVALVRAGRAIKTRAKAFGALACGVFLLTVLLLARFDLLPNLAEATLARADAAVASTTTPTLAVEPVEEPLTISIVRLKLEAVVANPTTTDIESLDRLLLKGAVRYPTSAKLGEDGNVVLFGHSSYLPVVLNPAYKTFNNIQRLTAGDVVTVSSAGRVYTYRIRTVAKESATDAAIPLDVSGRVLTLSTCDSFGAKTDRFVVTADFVESHPAAS